MNFIFGQTHLELPDAEKSFIFNFENFNHQFEGKRSGKSKITGTIQLPVPGTKGVRFNLIENHLIEKRISNIIAFNGVSEDQRYTMKLTALNDSFSAIVKSDKGAYFFFEKIENTSAQYRIGTMTDASDKSNFICSANLDFPELKNNLQAKSVTNFPLGTQIKKFRLAVAATGESAQALGNTDNVLAQVVSKFNSVSLAYETELAVTFTLIAETTNKTLIYADPATDPFTTTGPAESSSVFQNLNTSGVLTYDKYDIGHTVNITTGSSTSGAAGGSPCSNSSKAAGFTNFGTQSTLASATQVLCHEMGHQFGAGHTYNAAGDCASSWGPSSAVEPGAGGTFLAYANLCSSPVDVRYIPDRDVPFFHARSMDQILTKIANTSNCYTIVNSNNTPPVANAGVDITIPKNTPFKLTGIGTDANNTNLTYTWDQNDLATASDKGAMGSTLAGDGGYTAVNSTTAPLFRSRLSNVSGERYFPAMEFVLNNQNNPPLQAGEALSNVPRNINLRFAVRDNNPVYGGIDSDDINVTVSDTGPLAVSYPNASGVTVNAGSTIAVTWDVNNTNTLKNTVNILLSTDGGLTFPLQLATDNPNNGSANIIIPNVPSTSTARIKVVAVINSNAEFFDVSDNNFAISSSCAAYASYAYPTDAVTAVSGSSQANLNMTAPQAVAEEVSSYQSTYSTANLTPNNLYIYADQTQTTTAFQGVKNGIVKKFKVSVSGDYIFNRTSGYVVMSVHSGSPFTASNFVSASGYFNGTNTTAFFNTKSAYLTAGTDYYLLMTGASSGAVHTITANGPGKMVTETAPPAGYNYTFAAVGSNGNIVATSPTADFTSLPTGSYTVQGFSYLNSINPTTFINNSFSSMIIAGNCINLSKTNRDLTITSNVSMIGMNDSDNDGIPDSVEGCGGTLTIASITSSTATALSSNNTALFPLVPPGGATLPNGGVFITKNSGGNGWGVFQPTPANATVNINGSQSNSFSTQYLDIVAGGNVVAGVPRNVTFDFGTAASNLGTADNQYQYVIGIAGLGGEGQTVASTFSVPLTVAANFNTSGNNIYSLLDGVQSVTPGQVGTVVSTNTNAVQGYTFYFVPRNVASFVMNITGGNDSHGIIFGVYNKNCTVDTDGDGVLNYLDKDSDNDGITDNEETGCTTSTTASFNPVTQAWQNTNLSVVAGQTYKMQLSASSLGVRTASGGPNNGKQFYAVTHASGIATDYDGYRYNLSNGTYASTALPAEAVGFANLAATDYPNLLTFVGMIDTNGNGQYNPGIDVLIPNLLDMSNGLTGGVIFNATKSGTFYVVYADNAYGDNSGVLSFNMQTCGIVIDTDGDLVPDYLDTDSDGDGCPDAIEGSENVRYTHVYPMTFATVPLRGQIRVLGDGVTGGTPSQVVSLNTTGGAYGVPQLVNPAAPNGGTAGVMDNTDGTSDIGQGIGSSRLSGTRDIECDRCFRPATTTGTTLPSNHGITALARAGVNNGNWPMKINGAYTVLDAKTKGFVINRVPFTGTPSVPTGIAAANFVMGMMVYDTTNNCLKIYDGTGWYCYTKQTCDN